MAVPSPNILFTLFIIFFTLSALYHRSTIPSGPTQPSVFSRYAADILVPSTNDTFASRPAAFGGVFDSVLRGELVKCWGDGLACSNWDEENKTLVAGKNDSEEDTTESGIKLEDEGKDFDGLMRRSEGLLEMEMDKNRFKGKIVLVQRGKCAFAEKVRRVQEAGGIAVVVGDNTPSSGLLTMYAKGDTSDIHIPSTFIPHTSYLSLSYLLTVTPILDITILPSTASDWPLLDTLLLVVLSPLFTLACIYILLLLRRRVQRRKELAPLAVVRSLPTRRWTREKTTTNTTNANTNEREEDEMTGQSGVDRSTSGGVIPRGYGSRTMRVEILECVVCLEDFVEGDVVITLPCHHEFHESCITPWLTTRRRLCPICKRDIIAAEHPSQVSESSPLLQNQDQTSSTDWRGDTAMNV